jgi:hypothetical protein
MCCRCVHGVSHGDVYVSGIFQLAEKQREDAVLRRVLCWWRGGNKPTMRQLGKEGVPVRKMLKKWDKLVDREGVLCLIVNDTDLEENCVLVAPSAMKIWRLECLHDRAGHQGRERTLALLKKRMLLDRDGEGCASVVGEV